MAQFFIERINAHLAKVESTQDTEFDTFEETELRTFS